MASPRIVILGGGPTGLGAAHRLAELGHEQWTLLEQSHQLGGLASSFRDPAGFTWDLGGHVVFSHYEHFDRVLDSLPLEWNVHQREAWIWMRNRFVPYPFQRNLWRLPADDRDACLDGLRALAARPRDRGDTFEDWIRATFGSGIAERFLVPYNRKVWACEPSTMGASWTGDRVPTPDLSDLQRNTDERRDDPSWGPNSTFRFPREGGTGSIWKAVGLALPRDRIQTEARVTAVDTAQRTITDATGRSHPYDAVISTVPLDHLLGMLTGEPALSQQAGSLRWTSTHVVGIGLEGSTPTDLATKSWIYFPEPEVPFHRVTIFSNYSDHHVPRPGHQWSLLCEVGAAPHQARDGDALLDAVVAGLVDVGFIPDPSAVISRWRHYLPRGYPTPFLGRDELLAAVEPELRSSGILSRGRFGGWRYEVSNQDHSFMQGVEAVDHILTGAPEITLFDPAAVNGR